MTCQHKPYVRVIVIAAVVLAAVGVGWFLGSRAGDDSEVAPASQAMTPQSLFPDIAGKVVRLSPEDGVITVDHEEIEGFMAAMVMDLHVADPREMVNLKPGDEILFDLVKVDGRYRVVRIRRTSQPGGGTPGTGEAAPPHPRPLGRGDLVPDLSLVDAQGKPFKLHEMTSRHKLITFFYARCPLDEFCPAQSRRLAQLQGEIDAAGGSLHLVSLTLDADHDSADVLAGYAQRFNADPARWTLASGDDAVGIRDFASRVGARVQSHEVGYQIDHALVAVRVDGNRIVDLVYGLEAMEQMVRGMQPRSARAPEARP